MPDKKDVQFSSIPANSYIGHNLFTSQPTILPIILISSDIDVLFNTGQ